MTDLEKAKAEALAKADVIKANLPEDFEKGGEK